jgi:hypothetical protein
MDINLENGRIVCTDNGLYCIEKYYRDFDNLLNDFYEMSPKIIKNDFNILNHKYFVIDKKEFRFMLRIYLEGKR